MTLGNRLDPMDEDEDDEFETGYILATIRHRETFIQSKDWQIVRVLVDNCADEHVCSPRDFEWIAIEPSRDPHLVSASGHKLKHYGEQAVPMKLRDGRKIWITFQVCEVNGPIMSVASFVPRGTIDALHSRHVVVPCGTKRPERLQLTKFETTTRWNVGSNLETCWLLCNSVAPVEAPENLQNTMLQFHDEQMQRS